MYNPSEAGDFDNDEYEYIEVQNIGESSLLLNGVKFTGGISFNFPNISLAAGNYAIVVKDQVAFASRYNYCIDHFLPTNVRPTSSTSHSPPAPLSHP